jgi:hypothetical protein
MFNKQFVSERKERNIQKNFGIRSLAVNYWLNTMVRREFDHSTLEILNRVAWMF